MAKPRSGPPIAPVLHRSLLTGLLMLTGIMIVFTSGALGRRPVDGNQTLGYALSALSVALVAGALLVLKPRVPVRHPRQPVEEYWSSVMSTILPLWLVMEAAGLLAIIGYFMGGQAIAAVAIGVSIGAFIWYGPNAFAEARR
jgi:hypothetical protein